MDVQAAQLWAVLETNETVTTIALEVEHLEMWEEIHASELGET